MNGEFVVPPLAWASDAVLELPGSKSEANRVLVVAALSGRRVVVHGATPCDDVRRLVDGLATLGYEAHFLDEERGTVHVGPRRGDAPSSGEVFCGNAGTALRFLVSVAAITPGTWTVTGDAHMQRRPIGPLVRAWRDLGAEVDDTDGRIPVRVRGGAAAGGTTRLDPSLSSQFLSSLLLVGGALERGIDVVLERPSASPEYAAMTCAILAECGVDASFDERSARSVRTSRPELDSISVGGDWSAMGVWTAANELTGSRVSAANLRRGSTQPDEGLAEVLGELRGEGDRAIDVASIPDQFMNLAVVAARRSGTTRFTGAANLRVKECDRLAVTARELAKLGVAVREQDDGLEVVGTGRFRSATIDPEDDHRVAMAFALAALVAPEARIAVASPACVAKSYPGFWRDLRSRADATADGRGRRHARRGQADVRARLRGAARTRRGRRRRIASRRSTVRSPSSSRSAAGPCSANTRPGSSRRCHILGALRRGTVVAFGGGALLDDGVRASSPRGPNRCGSTPRWTCCGAASPPT
ncbi:MAG: hypothetical protein R3F34_01850 [Planctomycetota bacterium]